MKAGIYSLPEGLDNIMKKFFCILFALTLIAALVSCGGGGGGELTLGEDTEQPGTDKTNAYSFTGGTTVALAPHDDLAAYIAVAGTPVSYEESNSCAYLGLDKIWVYSGYTIYSYPDNGIDRLLQLVFTDDSVKTGEGISIGMSVDDVKAAYGTEFSSVGDSMVYTKGVTAIQFGIKDGKVTQVIYSAVNAD